jgi:hypothetical protein
MAMRGLIGVPISAAIPFTFRSWSTPEGLPENQVTARAQTRAGDWWVARRTD